MFKLTSEVLHSELSNLLSDLAALETVQSVSYDKTTPSSASQPTLTVVFDDLAPVADTFGYDSPDSFMADYAHDIVVLASL